MMGRSSWLQQFSISDGLLLGVDDTAQTHDGDRISAGKQTKLKADESRGRQHLFGTFSCFLILRHQSAAQARLALQPAVTIMP